MLLTEHFLHSDSPNPRLRVGVLLDQDSLKKPMADVLEHVLRSDFADLVLRVYNVEQRDKPPAPRASLIRKLFRPLLDARYRRSLLWALYDKVDARRAGGARRRLAAIDMSERLAEIPRIDVRPVTKGFVHRFPPEAVEAIRAYDLDLLLRFGFNIIRGDILRVPRFGVWGYHHGDNDAYRGGPSHFWELVEGHPFSGVILQVLTEELDAGTVLCKGLAPTQQTLLVSRNRVQPFLLGSTFAIRKMWELHRGGMPALQARMEPPAPYVGRRKIYRAPTNRQLAGFVLPALLRKAVQRPFQRAGINHWRMAFRRGAPLSLEPGSSPSLEGFRWIASPPGRFYADPFLWPHQGRDYCFFEDYEYASKRGRISCGVVTPGGDLAEVGPVLDLGHHLSYPYIFEDQGELFLIPESADYGMVELYRATGFPYRWERVHTLLDTGGIDTMVIRREGSYWMFTSVSEPAGAALQLMLLTSDRLTGPYRLHPESPLTADARYARGAGRIIERGDSLIRPSQDASGTYGRAIHFRRIVSLTETAYREEPLVTLEPPAGFLGVHSYDRLGDLEVIDGKKRESAARVRAGLSAR
jgi:hypothetical protein